MEQGMTVLGHLTPEQEEAFRKYNKDLLRNLDYARLNKVADRESVPFYRILLQIWKDKSMLLALIVILVITIPCIYLTVSFFGEAIERGKIHIPNFPVFAALALSVAGTGAFFFMLPVLYKALKKSVIADELPPLTKSNVFTWFSSSELDLLIDEYVENREQEVRESE